MWNFLYYFQWRIGIKMGDFYKVRRNYQTMVWIQQDANPTVLHRKEHRKSQKYYRPRTLQLYDNQPYIVEKIGISGSKATVSWRTWPQTTSNSVKHTPGFKERGVFLLPTSGSQGKALKALVLGYCWHCQAYSWLWEGTTFLLHTPGLRESLGSAQSSAHHFTRHWFSF